MIVTNLDHVPGRIIKDVMGMVSGYASGPSDGKGDSEFKRIYTTAEMKLLESGNELGADAVMGVVASINRATSGDLDILLIGTAVSLDPVIEEGMSIILDGKESEWSIPPASPSDEVAMMIRDRERSDRTKEKQRKDIYDLADDIGISYDRAKLLMDNGYKDLEDISEASSRDLASIEGINPTQARILKKRAREILDTERGL